MDIIGWIMFALLMSLFVGSLLGRFLAWCFREPVSRIRKHEQGNASTEYPRWYE